MMLTNPMSGADTARDAFDAGLRAQRERDLTGALRHYETCIEIMEADVVIKALAEGNRAIVLAQLGRHDDAISAFDDAVETLAEAHAEPVALVRFARNRGQALGAVSRFQDACTALRAVLEQVNDLRSRIIDAPLILEELVKEEAYTLLALGGLLLHIHEIDAAAGALSLAVHMLEEHCESEPQGMTSALINRAQANRELGKDREALQDLARARDFADRANNLREAARTDALRADLLIRLDRSAEALIPLASSVELARETGDLDAVVARTWLLARTLMHEGDAGAAMATMKGCEELAASIEAPKVRAEFYQAYANIAHSQDSADEFGHLKTSAAAWLVTVELQDEAHLRVALASNAFDVVRRLVVEYCQRGELEAAWTTWEAGHAAGLRAQLALQAGSERSILAQPIPPAVSAQVLFNWVRTRSHYIPTAVCALLFIPGNVRVLGVGPDGLPFSVSVEVPVDVFAALMSEFDAATPNPDSNFDSLRFEGALEALKDTLKPLFQLDGTQHLIILPTFELWKLPWSAILGRGVAVSIGLSATAVCSHLPTPQSMSSLPVRSIAIGMEQGVDFADESIAIGRLVPLEELATRESATRSTFRDFLGRHGIVHVSAHGEWFSGDPALSGVMLEDGRFGVADVLTVECRSPLVILSACDSGRLHVAINDDAVGLVPALVAMGTRNVIASLWPLSVTAATTFVVALLSELRNGASVIDALRAARDTGKKASRDVADWGAFELFGVG